MHSIFISYLQTSKPEVIKNTKEGLILLITIQIITYSPT